MSNSEEEEQGGEEDDEKKKEQERENVASECFEILHMTEDYIPSSSFSFQFLSRLEGEST